MCHLGVDHCRVGGTRLRATEAEALGAASSIGVLQVEEALLAGVAASRLDVCLAQTFRRFLDMIMKLELIIVMWSKLSKQMMLFGEKYLAFL